MAHPGRKGQTVHVYPADDLMEHDFEFDDCVCGPDVEYVEGGVKAVTHHSLDGREHHWDGHDREACPLCSTA